MSLDDVVRDRRVHPRLATRLPVRFSDFQYEWDGTCLSLSAGGCFIATGTGLPEDTDLDVDLVHPDGDALRVEGRVRWSREATSRVAGGLGIAFDFRKRGVLEALTDFVERLAVVDVKTATRFRAAGQPLPASTILYPARDAPPSPTLTTEERALLACVDGRASLHEIRQEVGEAQWDRLCFAPFSLIGKGVITQRKERAAALGPGRARAPVGAPASAGPTARQVIARSDQAQAYYQQALDARSRNDVRLALTNLRLALMLAPGDAEIAAAIAEIEG